MKKEWMGLIQKREDGSEEVNYDDPSFPSYIYEGWIKPNVTWARVPHFHEDIEMITVKTGKMAYSVNGKNVLLNAGDTIFVNSNQIHYTMAVDDCTATYVIFVASPEILSASVAVQMQAILPVTNSHVLPYLRFRNINEDSEEIYSLMMELPAIRRDAFQVTKKFFDIWEIILRQSKNFGMLNEQLQTDTYTGSFKAMMYFIQQNYPNPVTLDDISLSGNVSRSLCNRIFHKYVGDSPVNYLLNFRIRKVAEYLRTTSLSLSEIAAATGFNGTSYMSEMFKKYFGISPREFRKNPVFTINEK